jgi:hypothetical protein
MFVSLEKPQTHQNDLATIVHAAEAADHDDHCNPPLIGAILPSFLSRGEPLSALDVVVLSLWSSSAQNAKLVVSVARPCHHG